MTSYNLAFLPGNERRDLELRRQAALLIHNFKRGRISRQRIEVEILKLDENEQVKFKEFLNNYKQNPKQKLKEKNKRKSNGTVKARAMIKQYREQLYNASS